MNDHNGRKPPHPSRLAHTFSIVARDPRSGEMGVAVQSHWFSVGSLVAWAEAGVGAVATQSFAEALVEVMDDDFGTPRAIATLFDLGREVNTLLNSGKPASRATLEAMDEVYRTLGGDVLGILFDDGAGRGNASQADHDVVDGLVRMLIDMRQEARLAREWARADAIRDQLGDIGISLEDGPEGTRWRLCR